MKNTESKDGFYQTTLIVQSHQPLTSTSSANTLLALLATFLWASNWLQGYSRLDGFANTVGRLFTENMEGWSPINTDSLIMMTDSVLYWLGTLAAIITFILLVRKLFSKNTENGISAQLSGINEKIDKTNVLIQDLTNEIKKDRENITKRKLERSTGARYINGRKY